MAPSRVEAVVAGGGRVPLAGRFATVADVVAEVTADSLTGSAAPPDEAAVEAADGTHVRFGDVVAWVESSNPTEGG